MSEEWNLIIRTPDGPHVYDVSGDKLEAAYPDRITAYADAYNAQYPDAGGEGMVEWAYASVRGEVATAALEALGGVPEWWTLPSWEVSLVQGDVHPSILSVATVHELPALPPLAA